MLKSEEGAKALTLKEVIEYVMKDDAKTKILSCTPLLTIYEQFTEVFDVTKSVIYSDDLTEEKYVEQIWQKIYKRYYNKATIQFKPFETLNENKVNNKILNFFISIENIFDNNYNTYIPLLKKLKMDLQESETALIEGHIIKHTNDYNRAIDNEATYDYTSENSQLNPDKRTQSKTDLTIKSNYSKIEMYQHYMNNFVNYLNEWINKFDFLFISAYNYNMIGENYD